MIYYVNGEKIFIDETKKPFGVGSEGKAYKKDGKIYKLYYPEAIYEFGVDKSKCHQYLIGIPTKQIILPDALIFDEDNKYKGYRTDIAHGEKDVSKKQGISQITSEKFIENIETLESDMDLLANYYVKVSDVQPVNYFFDKEKEKMQIIDPGRYSIVSFKGDLDYDIKAKEMCKNINQNDLDRLITTLIYNDLVKFKPLNTKAKLQKLRDYIVSEKEKTLYSAYFKEKLKTFETPHEYFKSLGKYIK